MTLAVMVIMVLVAGDLLLATLIYGFWLLRRSMKRLVDALDTHKEQSTELQSMLSRELETQRLTALEYRISKTLQAAYDSQDAEAADELEGASLDALKLRMEDSTNGRDTYRC